MQYVIVYGTLKRGRGNHYLLEWQRFIGEVVFNGELFDNGSFPAWIHGSGKILGELYEVEDYAMPMLDSLESNGFMYSREKITVNFSGKEYEAWCYKWLHMESLMRWRRIRPGKDGLIKF